MTTSRRKSALAASQRSSKRGSEAPIDASADLSTGRFVVGPVELTTALLERKDQLVQALTQKLMMYALGRELEYFDMPQVRAIVRDAERHGYRFSAIVAGIVSSDAFRMQAVVSDAATVQASTGSAR